MPPQRGTDAPQDLGPGSQWVGGPNSTSCVSVAPTAARQLDVGACRPGSATRRCPSATLPRDRGAVKSLGFKRTWGGFAGGHAWGTLYWRGSPTRPKPPVEGARALDVQSVWLHGTTGSATGCRRSLPGQCTLCGGAQQPLEAPNSIAMSALGFGATVWRPWPGCKAPSPPASRMSGHNQHHMRWRGARGLPGADGDSGDMPPKVDKALTCLATSGDLGGAFARRRARCPVQSHAGSATLT